MARIRSNDSVGERQRLDFGDLDPVEPAPAAELDRLRGEVHAGCAAGRAELEQVAASAATCIEDAQAITETGAPQQRPDHRAPSLKPPMLVLELELLAVCVLLQGRAIVVPGREARRAYSPLPMTCGDSRDGELSGARRRRSSALMAAIRRCDWAAGPLYAVCLLFGLPGDRAPRQPDRRRRRDRLERVHVVLRVVAPCPAARAQPVRHPRDVRIPTASTCTWSAAMPGAGDLLVAAHAGVRPAVSWNVIQLLSPALSAWTAFLLCRQLSARTLAVARRRLHLRVLAVHADPLDRQPDLALVALRAGVRAARAASARGDRSAPRRFVVAMTAALTAQYLISRGAR